MTLQVPGRPKKKLFQLAHTENQSRNHEDHEDPGAWGLMAVQQSRDANKRGTPVTRTLK